MTLQLMKIDGRNPEGEPLHYTACGLDDVYLVNGFTRETIDGEQYTTIEDMDNLWKAICLHLVTKRKALAPKEIRYLRGQMDMTQAELASLVRVSDQTIARWEKGHGDAIPGPADLMLRVLYLASPRAQPEGGRVLDKLMDLIEKLVHSDEQPSKPAVFIHGRRHWRETVCKPELVYA
jgi:DNA-binding transcriptional regulator YiaG